MKPIYHLKTIENNYSSLLLSFSYLLANYSSHFHSNPLHSDSASILLRGSADSTTRVVLSNSLFSLSVSNAYESGRKLSFGVSNIFESRWKL